MSSKEMVVGGIYIVRDMQSIMKVEVLEITKTSMYLNNLDGDKKFRVDKNDFDYKCFVLEEIDPSFGKIIDPIMGNVSASILDSLDLEETIDLFKFEKELPQAPVYQTPEQYRAWNLLEKDLKSKWKEL